METERWGRSEYKWGERKVKRENGERWERKMGEREMRYRVMRGERWGERWRREKNEGDREVKMGMRQKDTGRARWEERWEGVREKRETKERRQKPDGFSAVLLSGHP